MARSALSRIRVLLVSPRSPGNVGAAARAVKNMGLGRLDLLEPTRFRDPRLAEEEARKLAVHAVDVLRRMRRFERLEDAVRPSAYLVATSARRGRSAPATTPGEAAPRLLALAADREVVLLFGPEDRGLPNRLIARASECLRIPASPRYPVLNVAQAVLLVGYQLRQAAAGPEPAPPPAPAAAPAELDGLERDAVDALTRLDFLKPHNHERVAADLRALLARARPSGREARMLRGMARQVRWLHSRLAREEAAGEAATRAARSGRRGKAS